MRRTLLTLAAALTLTGLLGLATPSAGEDPAGKKQFLDHKCNGCHAIQSQGIAVDEKAAEAEPAEGEEKEAEDKSVKPPDLSNVGAKRSAEFLHLFLRKKETIDGRKHRKRFSGTPEDRETLVSWLVTLKSAGAEKPKAK